MPFLLSLLFIVSGVLSVQASTTDESVEIISSYRPAIGSSRNFAGNVYNVDPTSVRILAYNYFNGWRNQPNGANTMIPLNPDGSWEVDVTTLPFDQYATELAVYAVPAAFEPPPVNNDDKLPDALKSAALANLHIQRSSRHRVIDFSGYKWLVKQSSGRVGPGPNYFSGRKDNVWVDDQGHLHLKLTQRGSSWHCAEIISLEYFGYGTYTIRLGSRVDQLDKNVVLGIFTWDANAPSEHYRELDIEFSRWGEEDAENAQFVVQPWQSPLNRERFYMTIDSEDLRSTHFMTWLPTVVDFSSLQGYVASPVTQASAFHQWNYNGEDIPDSGDESGDKAEMRFNLWLMQGLAPSDGQEVEVVIEAFEFVPALDRGMVNAGESVPVAIDNEASGF